MTEHIHVYPSDKINLIQWDTVYNGEQIRIYFEALQKRGTRYFIENTNHPWGLLQIGKHILPYTEGKRSTEKYTYLASMLSQYFDYTQEEVLKNDKYNKNQKRLARFILPIGRWLGAIMGMENVIFVNNYLISTNLYPCTKEFRIPLLIKKLKEHFPSKAIIFRSVNALSDALLLEQLQQEGGTALVCRQLYMMDPATGKYKKKRPYVMDKKLSEKTMGLVWKKAATFSEEERKTAIEQYRSLYLKKYSALNPHYTEAFLDIALQSGLLEYYLLMDENDGQVRAVQAVACRNRIVTTPFIGYDLNSPKSMGLYRLMNHQLMQLTIDNNYILNMSSGAAKFKKQRGGLPYFEYHVVIHGHLGRLRQLVWKILHYCSEKWVKPAMQSIEV